MKNCYDIKQVLLLGPYCEKIAGFLRSQGEHVINTESKITIESQCLSNTDFIISYGYRFILPRDIINEFKTKAINLHRSLLPWNRGSDPNLWSFLEETPKGVTIHCLDERLDRGDIIAQQEVTFGPTDTLKSSYDSLSMTLENLFIKIWPEIRTIGIHAKPQSQSGSFHWKKDRTAFEHLLTNGWDTPTINLIGKAKKHGQKEPI